MSIEDNKEALLTDEQLISHLNDVIKQFRGQTDELKYAIGTLILGRHIGWKPTYLLSNVKTLTKYQRMLGLDFKVQMPEVGYKAARLIGWQVAQYASNFWRVVSGQSSDYKKTKDWKTLE